jgi:integrase/recombinase XerD
MSTSQKNHPVNLLESEIAEFLIDREARNLSPKTLAWYRSGLKIWRAFAADQGILRTQDTTPSHLRRFILFLSERGHNPGGVANIYGTLKAFLNWFQVEYTPKDWQNPLQKVKNPKRGEELQDPIQLEDVRALLATCEPRTFSGDRDKAIILLLLDSGVRFQELTDLTVGDVDMSTGAILVRKGKGGKTRTTFIGAKTRRALLVYFRHRGQLQDHDPLWAIPTGGKLSRAGLREVIRRRAREAGIKAPGMHDFRRAFAINSLRAGMDLLTLQRLLGHSNLQVTSKYLKQLTRDLQAGHKAAGPVDNML